MSFDIKAVREAVRRGRVVYRVHAIQRMFSRRISEVELIEALDRAEVIEEDPNDKPYPSALLLGFTRDKRPLHVACAFDEMGQLIIITAYEPDATRWEHDWKTRRERR